MREGMEQESIWNWNVFLNRTLFDTIGLNVYPVMSLKITGTGLYRRSQKDDFPGGPEAGTRTWSKHLFIPFPFWALNIEPLLSFELI